MSLALLAFQVSKKIFTIYILKALDFIYAIEAILEIANAFHLVLLQTSFDKRV